MSPKRLLPPNDTPTVQAGNQSTESTVAASTVSPVAEPSSPVRAAFKISLNFLLNITWKKGSAIRIEATDTWHNLCATVLGFYVFEC